MVMTLSRAQTLDTSAANTAVASLAARNEVLTLNDYLRVLQPFGTRLHFTRDERIFNQEDPASDVFKIVSGTVRLCRHTADGRRCIIDFAVPGDIIGLLTCADQPMDAEAVGDVTLIAIPRSCIDRLASTDSAVSSRMLWHLSVNLLEAQQHLFVLGCQGAKERVASFLVRWADRCDLSSGDPLELPMGRHDIADHLGLTIETVSRAFSALKSEGLIALPNAHRVIIPRLAALRTTAQEV
jgi:CRP/FNR family nitrogen fixation transcriptional regulator